ncbi:MULTISPECIES: hypothetical protein [Mycobacterium]|uniref:hypothetical protein n=1 Tax=Mycobacterium TaxID=1763 RepID=UPI0007A0BA14|nr:MULTISPECIES: hypothetical protein [Mycobacterium]MCV7100915.1 hypothetical protein [Mycobacterium palustre]MDV3215730.1 hypothetical protein [Mycobacterium avium]
MNENNWGIIDPNRTAALSDVGAPDYDAATVVSADGAANLVLVCRNSIDDERALYDSQCRSVPHEQLGALPLATVKRIAVAQRGHRDESDQ